MTLVVDNSQHNDIPATPFLNRDTDGLHTQTLSPGQLAARSVPSTRQPAPPNDVVFDGHSTPAPSAVHSRGMPLRECDEGHRAGTSERMGIQTPENLMNEMPEMPLFFDNVFSQFPDITGISDNWEMPAVVCLCSGDVPGLTRIAYALLVRQIRT